MTEDNNCSRENAISRKFSSVFCLPPATRLLFFAVFCVTNFWRCDDKDVRLMPRDEAGSTPPFTVRIGRDPPDENPVACRHSLEPGAHLVVEVDFQRQSQVSWLVY